MNFKVIALLLSFLGGSLVSVSAQSIRSLLRKAEQQYEVRAYGKAIETYQQILERRSNNREALGNIADCFFYLNQMEEAADKYAQAVQDINRVEDRHILNFGKTLKALGRYDQAAQVFQVYASRNPTLGNHFAGSCDFAQTQQGVDTDWELSNEKVNSTASDFGPAFYLDEVVFSSGRTDVQRSTYDWDGQAKNQLFVARLGLDGFLQPPRFLKGTASTRGEGPAAFTPEGDYIAFTINDFISGTRQLPSTGNELVLYQAEIGVNGNWFNEKPFTHNDRDSKTGYPSFTPDGSAMFFASDREGGYGGYDLYISYREGDTWSLPINLGPVVNSAGDEISPFYDGEKLYFASNYHYGFGGFDVFEAEQRNGQWAEVNNMGMPVNSPRDDYGFIFDDFKNIGYLTSNRPGGRGAEDIYKVTRTAGSNAVIRVVSAADGNPVPFANLDFADCGQVLAGGSTRATTDSRGVYSFPVPYDLNCELIVNGQGFQTSRVPVNATALLNGQTLEISLARAGESFTGQVLSASGQRPLAGITITARNLTTGSTEQVMTNNSGTFQLALSPNTSYVIVYSGPGYREVRREINTQNMGMDGLSVTTLYPTSYVPDTDDPYDPGNAMPQRGFAIQLGALGKRPPLTRYSNLGGVGGGDVYVKPEGNIFKVRYGVFTTRAEANRYISAVKRQGYSDAFVVVEEGAQIGGGGTSPGTQPPGGNNPPPDMGSGGNYMIQLTALRNTRWFDGSQISYLGTIVDRRKGDLTLKLLSGFRSMAEAQSALQVVKQNGFPTAFIVQDVNGQLQRM